MSENEESSIKCIRIEAEVQENGIIRDSRGWIIGRADDDWTRYQWRMLDSGICPCCGKKVSEFPGDAHHVEPRTLEDVLYECFNECMYKYPFGIEPIISKYADELRNKGAVD